MGMRRLRTARSVRAAAVRDSGSKRTTPASSLESFSRVSTSQSIRSRERFSSRVSRSRCPSSAAPGRRETVRFIEVRGVRS